MPIVFTYPAGSRRPKVPNDRDMSGEDISLEGGNLIVTPAGDWKSVTGDAAARQSILRESVAAPGSFAHRPEWGVGLENFVRKPQSKSNRDAIETRATSRYRANRRVSRVISVKARDFTADDGGTGTQLDVQLETGRKDARIATTIRPKV